MKPTNIFVSLVATITLALLPAAHSQTPAKSPTPLRASVGEVTDNRSTGSFFAECKVELKFTGDAASDGGNVRQVRVTQALDELGRDLKPEKSDSGFPHSFDSEHSGGTLKAEVKLKNPSRNAGTIKVIKGEVELFNPTDANGANLHVKDVLKHPAEPIQNAALSKYGIVIMYLTKESYDAKKKELDAQQGGADAGNKLGAAFADLFKGMLGGMMSDSKNSVLMYIKDPQNRVVSLELQDTQGKALKTHSRWSSSDFQQTQLDAPPPADSQLLIQLAVPEAIRTIPFEVHDVPLP
jgi:hypothetical protein